MSYSGNPFFRKVPLNGDSIQNLDGTNNQNGSSKILENTLNEGRRDVPPNPFLKVHSRDVDETRLMSEVNRNSMDSMSGQNYFHPHSQLPPPPSSAMHNFENRNDETPKNEGGESLHEMTLAGKRGITKKSGKTAAQLYSKYATPELDVGNNGQPYSPTHPVSNQMPNLLTTSTDTSCLPQSPSHPVIYSLPDSPFVPLHQRFTNDSLPHPPARFETAREIRTDDYYESYPHPTEPISHIIEQHNSSPAFLRSSARFLPQNYESFTRVFPQLKISPNTNNYNNASAYFSGLSLLMSPCAQEPIHRIERPNGLLQCSNCSAFVNPFFEIDSVSHRMKCNCCNSMSNIPDSAYSLSSNVSDLPELMYGSFETVLYDDMKDMTHEQLSPPIVFVFDLAPLTQSAVSNSNQSLSHSLSLLLSHIMSIIRDAINERIRCDNRGYFGIVGMDHSSLHFFHSMNDKVNHLVVSDLDSPFPPLLHSQFIMDICPDTIDKIYKVLDSFHSFAVSLTQSPSQSVTHPLTRSLSAIHSVAHCLTHCGGRIMCVSVNERGNEKGGKKGGGGEMGDERVSVKVSELVNEDIKMYGTTDEVELFSPSVDHSFIHSLTQHCVTHSIAVSSVSLGSQDSFFSFGYFESLITQTGGKLVCVTEWVSESMSGESVTSESVMHGSFGRAGMSSLAQEGVNEVSEILRSELVSECGGGGWNLKGIVRFSPDLSFSSIVGGVTLSPNDSSRSPPLLLSLPITHSFTQSFTAAFTHTSPVLSSESHAFCTPQMCSNHSFSIQFGPKNNYKCLPKGSHFCQVSCIYTNEQMLRIQRVFNVRIETAPDFASVFNGLDLYALMISLTRSLTSSLSDVSLMQVRESATDFCAKLLANYRKCVCFNAEPSRFMIPQSLCCLPLFLNGLLKSPLLSVVSVESIRSLTRPLAHSLAQSLSNPIVCVFPRADDRVIAKHIMLTGSLMHVSTLFYPFLFKLDMNDTDWGYEAKSTQSSTLSPPFIFPKRMALTGASLDHTLIFLLVTFKKMYLLMGRNVSEKMNEALFGVSSIISSIQLSNLSLIDTNGHVNDGSIYHHPINPLIHSLIHSIASSTHYLSHSPTLCLRGETPSLVFSNSLVDDRVNEDKQLMEMYEMLFKRVSELCKK